MEARLKQQAEEREAERQRLKELEEIHTEMEKLLDTERQAKRDEEIVRYTKLKCPAFIMK